MLSVNVGFLSIPGVVPSSRRAPAEQIFSSISIIFSIGSIVVGLLLIRHHRIKKDEDSIGAVSKQGHYHLIIPG
jgi:hypothetical protein